MHAGATHTNLGHIDSDLPYESFRHRSLEEFDRFLPG
jgi:hypothetical protein